MAYIEAFILLALISYLFYKWSTANYGVLRKRGVPHEPPKPLVGNIELKTLLGKGCFLRDEIARHQKYKSSKLYGAYSMRDPIIYIRDPELIKQVGIKDFDNFMNHKSAFGSHGEDEYLSKSLIVLHDRRWKDMRATLSPSFTGSKMRLMFELIQECCQEGVTHIEDVLKSGGEKEVELDMNEFFTRFANDVIATVAFGIKVNSFKDKENEFYTIGNAVTEFKGWTLVKAILIGLIPKIMKALGFKLMDENQCNYFNRLVIGAMRERQQKNIVRPDMIHLLMEAKRQHEENKEAGSSELSDDDLIAQCLLFFLAGYSTVSVCLCFTTYELAMNQDAQQRLYEEILEMEQQLNGKALDYDKLKNMKYMDMVLSESLRKWPPVIFTDRVAAADYDLKDEDGNMVAELKKGDLIFLPVIGTHYDPDLYTEPEKFEPERFAEEHRDKIKASTYMPFGIGPRACIGNRLALMETKLIMYNILLQFKMVPAERTSKNMMNDILGFEMKPKDGFWIKFIPREK